MEEGMRRGIIDIHAHILPGVDDGSRDLKESLEMIRMAAAQGVTGIIATPHGPGRKEPEILLKGMQILREEVKRSCPDVQIALGQELLYGEELAQELKSGRALTLAGSRYVLVEFPLAVPYRELERGMRKVAFSGYQPVLAHMERYACLREERCLRDLCGSGYWLQMNYESLCGPWYRADVRWCRRQVEEGRIQVLGSDMHRADWRPPRIQEALRWLEGHVRPGLLEAMTWKNPMEVIKEAKKYRD